MASWHEHSEEELIRIGREALRSLRFDRAHEVFAEYTERLHGAGRPVPAGVLANYAVTVGHRKSVKEGLALCQAALKSDRRAPEVYFCLAQLYLMAKARRKAWEAIHQGLSFGPRHPGLLGLQAEMGLRKRPVLPFLNRDHAINVRLGRVLRRIRKRRKGPGDAA
ncbi:MAG: tetratricopeptide repeat protein [Thermoanaerobaculia bacterium]